ncbi:hypothetical protein [Spongiactinospora sp. TRM90649]|uniref:hypothetical protein n=1 Tax=Spongiactinospora sp. TRM90649 TaxID=3031114 RepID=UPI0023F62D15|nr:hypothetical protein [Spongiactinospora sp. TRM90649]MDF5753259.1 hypothetical protein [Spongiactinospora sp. TRM90649]
MPTDYLELDDHELWAVVQDCDPIEMAHRALARRYSGRAGPAPARAAPGPGGVALALTGGGVRITPPERLATLWGATVAAATAHHLIPPGVVVAGLVVEGGGVDYLAMLCRALPDLSHVVLHGERPPDPLLTDLLDAHGVRAGYAPSPEAAFHGSDIVISHGRVQRPLSPRHVLIEAGEPREGPAGTARVFADRPLPGERDLGDLLTWPPSAVRAAGPVVVRVREPAYGAPVLPARLFQAALSRDLGTRPDQ